MERERKEMAEEWGVRGDGAVRAVDLERLAKMPLEALLYWVLKVGRREEAV
jgi:hypothetical protein